jgi:hypothetical protein
MACGLIAGIFLVLDRIERWREALGRRQPSAAPVPAEIVEQPADPTLAKGLSEDAVLPQTQRKLFRVARPASVTPEGFCHTAAAAASS